MRLRIRHQLHYRFSEPVRHLTTLLRLTPRSHEGQHVMGWRIDVDRDCVLKAGEDGFGNVTHRFTANGPCEEITVSVSGEVDNFDTAGVLRGTLERLPLQLYLRETPLTVADQALRQFADEKTEGRGTDLEKLHALLGAIHEMVARQHDAAPDSVTAAQAYAAGRGTSADLAHVFIACARHLKVPARFTIGYCHRPGQETQRHHWAEAYVSGLGWTGFDPTLDLCPEDSHVRVAVGLDGLGAAPVRSMRTEVPEERLEISVPFASGWSGRQNQTQRQG